MQPPLGAAVAEVKTEFGAAGYVISHGAHRVCLVRVYIGITDGICCGRAIDVSAPSRQELSNGVFHVAVHIPAHMCMHMPVQLPLVTAVAEVTTELSAADYIVGHALAADVAWLRSRRL